MPLFGKRRMIADGRQAVIFIAFHTVVAVTHCLMGSRRYHCHTPPRQRG